MQRDIQPTQQSRSGILSIKTTIWRSTLFKEIVDEKKRDGYAIIAHNVMIIIGIQIARKQ